MLSLMDEKKNALSHEEGATSFFGFPSSSQGIK